MILVQKKRLYILTALFCALIIFGEIKFFHAVNSVNLAGNLDIKYEVENFIFAAIVLMLVVFLFLVYFMWTSRNVIRKMDKMIELSEYGKYDISAQLKDIGLLGKKVGYLMYYQNDLNDKRSLKISSLSGINDLLLRKIKEMLVVVDYGGKIMSCSERFLQDMRTDKKEIKGREFDEVFIDMGARELFTEFERTRESCIEKAVTVKVDDREKKHKAEFYPITNVNDKISHIVAVLY